MVFRPGQASVHYGDLRGEVAADFFQGAGSRTDLQSLAHEMGWEGKGRVVGMNLSLGERKQDKTTMHCFYLTLQVTDQYDIDILQKNICETGKLKIREVTLKNVDMADIIKYFKRLEIGLFTKSLIPTVLEVEE